MTNIALPPHVQRRIDIENRRRRLALILRNSTIEDPRCREWTTKLQRISPDLYMVKANDTVEKEASLLPGYFHLLVMANDATPFTTPLTNNGAYVEPGDWIYRVLAAGNLRERRVRDALEREQTDHFAAVEKEREEAKRHRMEKVRDIVNSATRAQISMDTTLPWSQNSAGRRGHR